MSSFLQEVIEDLQKKNTDFSQTTFVLPSKRAGVFLMDTLAKNLNRTIFAPKILSIEALIETISGFRYASNTELLFEFYEAYLETTPKINQDTFEEFSKWAPRLLQDFNEIDRQLTTPDAIFDYLKDIKQLENWQLTKDNITESIKNYLAFWNRIKPLYHAFKNRLTDKKKGYQGLVYRESESQIDAYISKTQNRHIFVGFNALTKAEESIIQKMLMAGVANVYWDIDTLFMDNPVHDAAYFLRSYKEKWSYFQKHPFDWVGSNYTSKKIIHAVGTPKSIGQAKYVGELLKSVKEQNGTLNNTAVVLADENLLSPLLNSFPDDVDGVNITMGLPLKSVPLASFFDRLFGMHKLKNSAYYHKDIEFLLTNPFIRPLFDHHESNVAEKIVAHLQDNNTAYASHAQLKELGPSHIEIIDALFETWGNTSTIAIDRCISLISLIKNQLVTDKSKNLLALEYLYRFNTLFNELRTLNDAFAHIPNVASVSALYKELLKSETLDFKGEPLVGLQIMGMLETRVLDFDTVIFTSANEDILPAGKTSNSFIPFDVKLQYGLPTYKEKDAVYSYHFYRLLQRAKHVYILYNTEPNVLIGGEKSRFISQMEIEALHPINHYIVAPDVQPTKRCLRSIKKTPAVIEKIKKLAERGFSPSSITKYIRNPFDFYTEYILEIKQFEELEETVAANTLGNVIHQTLEDFYRPLKGKVLDLDALEAMKTSIETTVKTHFANNFKNGDVTKGKNLIVFEIAKRYVLNFLNKETEAIKNGDQIKIIDVEKKVNASVPIPELGHKVNIKGSVDRIDECNGVRRIIDYKTGKVNQNQVSVNDWDDITKDYKKYSKSFQVLAYCYMLNDMEAFDKPVEAGVVSFKNLKDTPFIRFTKKGKAAKDALTDNLVTKETLSEFAKQLQKIIKEICDPEIDFVEKIPE
ncbi:MAG TPA: PD-(D/E)XK nuclease family protein [Aquaticitalea sp.]|nr:PD-(D/E)XK nuclease family protein [Aquaticitalea sp.]